MALRLSFYYDLVFPTSWVFYQALKRKLPVWQKYRQILIEYLPVSYLFLHHQIHRMNPASVITTKKDYMMQELYDICDFYKLPKGNFELTYQVLKQRNRTAFLLLNLVRRTRPEFYESMMERMFHVIWHEAGKFENTSHLFRLGREIGIQFGDMDKLIMSVGAYENYVDMGKRHMHLLMQERITSVPWLRIDSISPNEQKLMGFGEIMQLELMDELMAQPFYNPLNYGNPILVDTGIVNKEEEQTENFHQTHQTCHSEGQSGYGGRNLTNSEGKKLRKQFSDHKNLRRKLEDGYIEAHQ